MVYSTTPASAARFASRKAGTSRDSAAKRENANEVVNGDMTSYMAAVPSIAPSAIALVVKLPATGYKSTYPHQEKCSIWGWDGCMVHAAGSRLAIAWRCGPEALPYNTVRLIAGHSLARRGEGDVDPVLGAGDACHYVVAPRRDGPVAQAEGGARHVHLHGELLALLEATLAQFEALAAASAVNQAPAPVLLVELGRPERGVGPLALAATDERADVKLGDVSAVHGQARVVELEDGLLGPHVYRETWDGEEVE